MHTTHTGEQLDYRLQCKCSIFLSINVRILLTAMEVAVVYLATGVIAGSTFILGSFWVYHYASLELESEDMNIEETGFSTLE